MLLGGGVLIALAIIALAAPLIAPYDPETIDADRVLAPPEFAHLLGSDALGRDVLSRVIYGLRASLLVSISAVLGIARAGGAAWASGRLFRTLGG